MYCRNCGKMIPDDSNYCNYCGVKTETATKKHPFLALLLIIVIILCLVVFLISSRYLIKTLFPAPLDYEKLSQSVVKVCLFDSLGREDESTGSGVIVLYDNVIVTNYHVIIGDTLSVEVMTDHGDRIGVKSVLAYDEAKDIALLELERAPGYPPMPIGNSTYLKKGNKVSAIGSPLGKLNTVSEGIISGFDKVGEVEMIQFTAPISGGSSGGALLNAQGELIGITSAIMTDGQNLNYAIPAYEINRVLDTEKVNLPFIDFYNLTEHENLLKTVQEIYENRATLNRRNFAVIGEIAEVKDMGAYIIDPDTKDNSIRIFIDFSHVKEDIKIPEKGTKIYSIGLFINASDGPVFYPDTFETR